MIFERTKLIRFAHCDPAGIVFYPRYVELCNEVVEDWFGEALGVGFNEVHEVRRLGIPAVKLELEFVAPSRYGDVLTFQLCVSHLGRSSMHLEIVAECESQVRLRIILKVVMAALDTLRPVLIDDFWRPKFAAYMHADPAPVSREP